MPNADGPMCTIWLRASSPRLGPDRFGALVSQGRGADFVPLGSRYRSGRVVESTSWTLQAPDTFGEESENGVWFSGLAEYFGPDLAKELRLLADDGCEVWLDILQDFETDRPTTTTADGLTRVHTIMLEFDAELVRWCAAAGAGIRIDQMA